MNVEARKYAFEGVVMMFDRIYASNVRMETTAVSEAKARSNMTYRFKLQNGLSNCAKISLVGKIFAQ